MGGKNKKGDSLSQKTDQLANEFIGGNEQPPQAGKELEDVLEKLTNTIDYYRTIYIVCGVLVFMSSGFMYMFWDDDMMVYLMGF